MTGKRLIEVLRYSFYMHMSFLSIQRFITLFLRAYMHVSVIVEMDEIVHDYCERHLSSATEMHVADF